MTPEEQTRKHRLEDQRELRRDVGLITSILAVVLAAILIALSIVY